MAYGTRKFIAAVTNVRHWILSWAISSQFSSQTPTSRGSLLIFSSQRRIGLPNGLLLSDLPTRIEYNRFSPIRSTWPAHLSRRDFIIFTTFGESYSPWNSSLCSLLPSFGPISARMQIKTLFSNTRNFCSSTRIVLQLSQP